MRVCFVNFSDHTLKGSNASAVFAFLFKKDAPTFDPHNVYGLLSPLTQENNNGEDRKDQRLLPARENSGVFVFSRE